MAGISVEAAPCVRLINNEITLGSAVPLARRYAKDGFWQIECLERPAMAALLAYACDPRGPDPDNCAEVVHGAIGLIGRDDNRVRATLRALPLCASASKEDTRVAHRLVRAGVLGPQLAAAVRRAKLGLGETPPYCEGLTLCDRGVVLGYGTVIAPLVEQPDGRFGLSIDGRTEEILALLSVARGAPAPANTLDRLRSVSQALQRGDRVLAEIGLALVGQPALAGRAAAEALAKMADALRAGVDPRLLTMTLEIASPVEKANPDDPKHPGWPKGAPNSQGGRFRPKTPDDDPNGPPEERPNSRRRMTNATAEAIKLAIRSLLADAESAPNPYVRLAVLLAEVGLEAYPCAKSYFDGPKSLEELQAAAQSPSEVGYEDHHIVEQATANPDGSEDVLMGAPENLARIPTMKHWELNR
jgi:hypothetical protein